MTDFVTFALTTVYWIAILLLTYLVLRNLKILDHYRKKYGFDRTIESKFFKNDKELNHQEKNHIRRARKY